MPVSSTPPHLPALLCAKLKNNKKKRDKDLNFYEEQRIERKTTKETGRKGGKLSRG